MTIIGRSGKVDDRDELKTAIHLCFGTNARTQVKCSMLFRTRMMLASLNLKLQGDVFLGWLVVSEQTGV